MVELARVGHGGSNRTEFKQATLPNFHVATHDVMHDDAIE